MLMLYRPVTGSHFRFATISCAPSPGNALQARCSWRSSWRLNDGPCGNPCTEADIGQLSNRVLGNWRCFIGCGPVTNVAPHRYFLTAIDRSDFWQQGYNDFTFNLPNAGVFTVGYTGCCWVTLANGGGSWVVITEYNAGIRSDTGTPNSSPITTSKPLIDLDITCGYRFEIPYADADGDTVQCRWATGIECGGICSRLPGATLYPNCTLVIPASARPLYGNGLYGVAIMLEDFPTTSITQGGVPKDELTPLSKVPLQPITDVMCSGNDRYTLNVTVVHYCNAGVCAEFTTSNTVFSDCTVANSYQNVSTETLCSVADTVSPICTFNPFFLFFTTSGYRCMCPLGSYPFIFPFSYVSSASTAVSACFPISGSYCTT
ncbi:uncharacterized protein LOC112041562, partial [Lingula anatina]|uniref:Uncharacterized protein LOC112041562 n=1 Tax=Lingula anatina TaxID=7574 RepID=A0A2R2MKI0_LINAN